MARAVTRTEAIREIPQKAGGAVLTARFIISKDIELTRQQIQTAARQSLQAIRQVMVFQTLEAYRQSGLRVISGRLLRQATTRFSTKLFLRGNNLVVEFEWNPTIAYFFIHLFGGTITPRRAEFLHFKIGEQWVRTKRVVIPRRNFLKFDRSSRAQIQDILNDNLASAEAAAEVTPKEPLPTAARRAMQPRERRRAPTRARRQFQRIRAQARIERLPARRIVEPIESPSGRITPFRVRKALRQPRGPLTATEARALAKQLTAIGLRPELIRQILGLRREQLIQSAGAIQLVIGR